MNANYGTHMMSPYERGQFIVESAETISTSSFLLTISSIVLFFGGILILFITVKEKTFVTSAGLLLIVLAAVLGMYSWSEGVTHRYRYFVQVDRWNEQVEAHLLNNYKLSDVKIVENPEDKDRIVTLKNMLDCSSDSTCIQVKVIPENMEKPYSYRVVFTEDKKSFLLERIEADAPLPITLARQSAIYY